METQEEKPPGEDGKPNPNPSPPPDAPPDEDQGTAGDSETDA